MLINENDQSDRRLFSSTSVNYNNTIIGEDINEIDIFVREKIFQNEPQTQSYFSKYKKLIMIISIIIIIIIISLICVFVLLKKKEI
jgi:ABC-type antimicrobial peptide transport system permease subunit